MGAKRCVFDTMHKRILMVHDVQPVRAKKGLRGATWGYRTGGKQGQGGERAEFDHEERKLLASESDERRTGEVFPARDKNKSILTTKRKGKAKKKQGRDKRSEAMGSVRM